MIIISCDICEYNIIIINICIKDICVMKNYVDSFYDKISALKKEQQKRIRSIKSTNLKNKYIIKRRRRRLRGNGEEEEREREREGAATNYWLAGETTVDHGTRTASHWIRTLQGRCT